jgi:hypothetical protein
MIPGNIALGNRENDDGLRTAPLIFDGVTVTNLPYQWSGDVVDGTSASLLIGHSNSQPAQWIDGVLHELPAPEGCTYVRPVAVNASGVILGRAYCPDTSVLLWTEGKVSTLATPKPIAPPESFLSYYDIPKDINDSGMILLERGYILTRDGAYTTEEVHSLVYNGATWHELPYANLELANDGHVFGLLAPSAPGAPRQTFVWEQDKYIILDSLIDNPQQTASLVDAHPDGRLLVRFVGGGLPEIYAILNPGPPTPPVCRVDWDGNGVVNSTDVSSFINDWFQAQTGECP